jgi:hypothetical protein
MSLPKGSKEYKESWDQFFETVNKPGCCPFCQGSRIYWNGYRERSASVLDGDKVVYLSDVLCRRVKCANRQCKKSWTLRPPGLMPGRHYQMGVVANAARHFLFDPHSTLTSVADAHQCCRRTLGRWLHWVAGIAKPSALICRLRRLGALSRPEVFARRDTSRAMGTRSRKIFERTARVFGLLEALGRAHGYEQSPFARMIESILSGRGRVTPYRFPAIPELAR